VVRAIIHHAASSNLPASLPQQVQPWRFWRENSRDTARPRMPRRARKTRRACASARGGRDYQFANVFPQPLLGASRAGEDAKLRRSFCREAHADMEAVVWAEQQSAMLARVSLAQQNATAVAKPHCCMIAVWAPTARRGPVIQRNSSASSAAWRAPAAPQFRPASACDSASPQSA
jgi:hypothetical protein